MAWAICVCLCALQTVPLLPSLLSEALVSPAFPLSVPCLSLLLSLSLSLSLPPFLSLLLQASPTPDAMSQANKQTSPADGGSVASRTRRQTRIRGRDEDGEEKQPAAPPSSHVSPAMRLYRHALECILAMLELTDLIHILSVSRSWSAAVQSMAPIHASIQRRHWCENSAFRPLPPIESIVGSPLLRHLAAIQISQAGRDRGVSWTSLNNASIGLLAEHAPNLTSLGCELRLMPNEPLLFPARLTTLTLQLDDECTDAAINGVLTALAAHPSLSGLCLNLFSFNHENSAQLSLLAASRSLSDFTLTTLKGDPPMLSSAQISQIRSSLGHLHRFSVRYMSSDWLARLLQPPVTASWEDIGMIWADDRTGDLLLRLQTLTRLDLTFIGDTARVDFLRRLPLLTSLTLNCSKPGDDDAQQAWFIPADALLASLMMCSDIAHLGLTCGFNSAQWSALFEKLKIAVLSIRWGDLKTLRCFAAGPITESLEELSIQGISLPPSEVSHLYALHRLRTLHLTNSFSPPQNDATIASLSPPTPLLPALTGLTYECQSAGGAWDIQERQGASFEWMQQRRTQ